MITVGKGYRQYADKEATVQAYLDAWHKGSKPDLDLAARIEQANPELVRLWDHVGRAKRTYFGIERNIL